MHKGCTIMYVISTNIKRNIYFHRYGANKVAKEKDTELDELIKLLVIFIIGKDCAPRKTEKKEISKLNALAHSKPKLSSSCLYANIFTHYCNLLLDSIIFSRKVQIMWWCCFWGIVKWGHERSLYCSNTVWWKGLQHWNYVILHMLYTHTKIHTHMVCVRTHTYTHDSFNRRYAASHKLKYHVHKLNNTKVRQVIINTISWGNNRIYHSNKKHNYEKNQMKAF